MDYQQSQISHTTKINAYQNKYTHTHSASFIRVSSFILKFGLYALYTDFKIFSQSVKVGDIIILDSNNDNSWDHIGFVSVISTTLGTYIDEDGKSRSYYNFKVAQHSNNYHLQVNDNNNDWEKFRNRKVCNTCEIITLKRH